MSGSEFWGSVAAMIVSVCLWIGMGVLLIAESRADFREVDVSRRCETAPAPCLREEPARVVDLDTVVYDDGRATEYLELSEGSLQPGDRVVLEFWEGELVSVYEPRYERRLRTGDWPERWEGAVALGFGALMLVPFPLLLAALTLGEIRRRRVRRAAPPRLPA